MKNDITLWDFVGIAQRHWRLILTGFVATMVLATVGTLLLTPKYRSEALLLVRLGRENLGVEPIAGLADKSGVNMVDTRENEVNSMANVLKSRELAEQVIERLSPSFVLNDDDSLTDRALALLGGRLFPYYAIGDRDKAIVTLQNKLRIKPLDKSSVIRVSYDAKDPLQAQKIVDTMVAAYLAHHSQIHRTSGSLEFLENELSEKRGQLLSQEAALRELKSQTGLSAPAEQRAALVGRISKLKTDLMEATANHRAIQMELETLSKTLGNLSETEVASQVTGAGNSAVDAIRSKVFDLQTQLNELLSKYTEEHIKVKQLREAIANAETILREEEKNRRQTTQGRSRSFDETNLLIIRKQSERDALAEKIKSLEAMVADEEGNLETLSAVELQIDQQSREIAILNANYQKYSSDVERARIDADLELKSMTNVSVAQPASLNYMPVFPIVPLNLAMGGVLGVFLGGLLALLAELRSQPRGAPPAELAAANGAEQSLFEFAAPSQEVEPAVSLRHPR